MSYTVNMKQVNAQSAATEAAFALWVTAGGFALKNHSGYVQALKTNAAAWKAADEMRGYMNQLLSGLHSDPDTDPAWFDKIGKLRDRAIYIQATLVSAKQAVLADLAAHFQISMPSGDASKYATDIDAAAAVDAKAKAAAPNPNARKTTDQDAGLPPVETPPAADETRWGLYAGLAAGGALLLKILKVW